MLNINRNLQYSKTDLTANYKQTKLDFNITDKNGKKIDFSMTIEDINFKFQQDSLSYTSSEVYDQSKVAKALNEGNFDEIDKIFKQLKEKHAKLQAQHTQIEGDFHSIKIEGLTQEEAKALVSEDGYFGVNQTAKRVFDFVVKGANDDPELLKAGRRGVVQGLKDAEEAWGGKLPDIAYETQNKTLQMLDEYMAKLGIVSFDEKI